MKQRILLCIACAMVMFSSFTLKAQVDTTYHKKLVISEIREVLNWGQRFGYLELTNMGDSVLNLEDYWIQGEWNKFVEKPYQGDRNKWSFVGEGTIAPGESYLFVSRCNDSGTDVYGNRLYPNGYINEYVEAKADHVAGFVADNGQGTEASGMLISRVVGLFYRGDTSRVDTIIARDSLLVDKFWFQQEDVGGGYIDGDFPIAGFASGKPYRDMAYARKFIYKHGQIDFETRGRGTNMEDSEWIPYPYTKNTDDDDRPFTTLGNHGSSTALDVSGINGISVDATAMEISVPYGVRRDSIFWNFNIGPNHTWDYHLGPDTSQWYVSTGDMIDFYVLGDGGAKYTFDVKVLPREADMVKVRPSIYKMTNGNWGRPYILSDGMAEDTIGNIHFATPTDSLLKYLVLEDGATSEFVWVDGIARPEVMHGDKLTVTAGGNSKTYRLSVYNFIPNHNADLRTIQFPGFFNWLNLNSFLETDTMLDFRADVKSYVMTLPEGTEKMPALLATPSIGRSKVYVKRASNLYGSEEDRTATISIVAEDDTTTNEYKILFNVEREVPEVEGTLFFSDFATAWNKPAPCNNIQIFNPTSEEIFMDDYLIIKVSPYAESFNAFWDDQFTKDGGTNKDWNANILRPGFIANQGDVVGEGFFVADGNASRTTVEGNGTFTLSTGRGWPNAGGNNADFRNDAGKAIWAGLDYMTGAKPPKDNWLKWAQNGPFYVDRFGEDYRTAMYDGGTWWPFNGSENWKCKDQELGGTYIIAKILNDSIISGEKSINAGIFTEDYEIVDVLNGISTHKAPYKIYDTFNGVDTVYDFSEAYLKGEAHASYARKPHIYKGNTIDVGSFGSEGMPGEWMVYGLDKTGRPLANNDADGRLGSAEYGRSRWDNHTMLSYAHLPFLSSTTYLISLGMSDAEEIHGVIAGTTVDGFMDNVILADTAMTVVIKNAAGVEKAATDALVVGDKVESTSANGLTSVIYSLNVGVLSSDVSLAAKSGTDLMVDGLVVKNVAFGTTLKAFIEDLEVVESSALTITDGMDFIVPLEAYSADTMTFKTETPVRTDILVKEMYKVEVKAQDGTTAVYAIQFAAEDELYVLSDVYKVLPDIKHIDFVGRTSVATLLKNMVASPGADLYVINKMGQKRELGILQYDDLLVVEKGAMKVVYRLKFSADESWNVSAESIQIDSEVYAYPNPTQGLITISKLEGATQVQVRNLAGQLLKSVSVSQNEITLPLAGDAGVYLISVLKGNTVLRTLKAVKQ